MVFLIGLWAVKLPRITEWRLFLLGLLANMQERLFSATGWPKLCPVVWSLPGGWVVVMRRAQGLSLDEWERFDVDDWRDCGEYIIPAEAKRDSYGWLNGRIVAVDYGS